jgi:phosphatidate cytidylyltransferase
MLAHRIATALVMLAILAGTLMAPSRTPFAVLMLVLVAACAWEWARLNGWSGPWAWVPVGATVAAVALWLHGVLQGTLLRTDASSGASAWAVAGAAWLLGSALSLRGGVQAWRAWPAGVRLVLGVLIFVVTWFAVVRLHGWGMNTLLSTMCIVWACDIGGYFGGKGLGGKVFGPGKLAPSISPSKTWEGVVSGLVAVLAVALIWALLVDTRVPVDSPSIFTWLALAWGWPAMLMSVALLAVMGILGDLVESLVKRAAGAKDSSWLLPGHGGVLDRVDALLPVLPMAVAMLAHARRMTA